MKKFVSVLLSILLVAALSSCGEKKISENEKRYSAVLEKYRSAITDDWSLEEYEKEDICRLLFYKLGSGSKASEFGYYFKDINSDGTDELFIGPKSSDEYIEALYEIYTVSDGSPKRLAMSGEKNKYYLCSDGTIADHGSGGSDSSGFYYFKFNGIELDFVEGILYDASVDEKNPWFVANGADYFSSPELQTTNSYANSVIDRYRDMYLNIPYIHF